jgi:hypothetical protein
MQQKDKTACAYCKGALFIHTGYTEKIQGGHRALYPYTQPCYCELNKYISKKFGILSPIPDATPEDSNTVCKAYGQKKPGILFLGSEPLFLYIVKSFFLKGFTHKDYMLLEGINVVEQYNVPQRDGNRPTIAYLDQYDLLAILFTSRSEPGTLKPCIADLVKSRFRLGKITWIYASSKEALSSAKEYSEDLATYFEAYFTVNLDSTFNLKGFSDEKSERTQIKRARSLQDELGKV